MNGKYTTGRRSQRINTSLEIKELDPTPTKKLTITGKECSRHKTGAPHYYVLQKLVKAYFA